MPFSFPQSPSTVRGWLLGAFALLLVLWITFFDSHSLLRRYQWHRELDRLTEENDRLRQQIETLEHQIDQPLSDEVVERIAREEYGMKRPGETVYRVEPE